MSAYNPHVARRLREGDRLARQTWRNEHPRANVPPEVADRVDLQDVSWHNDACPSFVRADGSSDLRLWVDYEDPSERECGGSRYFVLADHGTDPIYDGDDVDEALAALFATMSHTPGPWHQDETGICAANGRTIINIEAIGGESPSEVIANAALIAGSPELVDAIVALLEADAMRVSDDLDVYAIETAKEAARTKARAALAKASK